MGIIFFNCQDHFLSFNQTAFLFSTCFDNLACRGSDSHFILNSCYVLAYCHQSDVSKLPQVISDHCKRINTE